MVFDAMPFPPKRQPINSNCVRLLFYTVVPKLEASLSVLVW